MIHHANYSIAEVTKMHKTNQSSLWLKRPLPANLLAYAAKDIELISTLCTSFIQKGWIPADPTAYYTLLRQCARYVSAHREQGRSREDDPFRPTGIMPLDVLNEPEGPMFQCVGCRRGLSLVCYQTTEDESGMYRWRRPRCSLCHVLAMKNRVDADTRWFLVPPEPKTQTQVGSPPGLPPLPSAATAPPAATTTPLVTATGY